MLNGLIQTMFIAIGMSLNGMPICHKAEKIQDQEIKQPLTPKKANGNEEHTYALDINATNLTTITTDTYYETQKANLSGSNSYINVVGNTYIQTMFSTQINNETQPQRVNYIANAYRTIYNENWDPQYTQYYEGEQADITSNWGEYVAKGMVALKITPYNFNVETQITIRFIYSLREITLYQDNEYNYADIYTRFRTYKSVVAPNNTGIGQNNSFDKYIGLQPTKNMVGTIEREIIDPNQNFYYNVAEETNLIGQYHVLENWITKQITIDITPSMDNYFIFTITPIVRPTTHQENAACMMTARFSWPMRIGNWDNTNQHQAITITGTNIIPSGTYEIIDLPGLMWEIIGMPFAFISQAFDLTLFPGTPYQLNIANLFLAIVALLIFIFIIKLIAQLKG